MHEGEMASKVYKGAIAAGGGPRDKIARPDLASQPWHGTRGVLGVTTREEFPAS